MSKNNSLPLNKIKVLTDEIEVKPFLDFDRYTEAIVRIIKGSEPNFSIGIYGEWGTGKTTLMRSAENKLQSDVDILTIWFNAWRYEREEQFALVPLLKTIAYKMDEKPKYDEVKVILFKSVITAAKGLASKIISDKYVDELEKNFTSQMKALLKVDKDTIFYHGMKQIEDVMNKILENSPDSRIVVFIDDLDRCSPKKALEVFESIKVFLGIRGFVYIVGLSHETIGKLISAEYEKSGIKGEQYIKKIIQIPIMVPEWNSNDLGDLLVSDIAEKLDDTYSKIVKENKTLISVASESNPRELKRFINNFIVSNEIFSLNREIHPQQLLAIQALKVRWPSFYRDLTSIEVNFRNRVEKYVSMKYEDRIRELKEVKAGESDIKNIDRDVEQKLLEIDPELWSFLDKAKQIIFSIKNWEIYRRAAESTKADLTTPVTTVSSNVSIFGYTQSEHSEVKLLELLEMGNVAEFNNRRKTNNLRPLEFHRAKLEGINLQGANLQRVNLRISELSHANLSGANLSGDNLKHAVLRGTNLSNADLQDANLEYADLSLAILQGANLQGANLWGAALGGADLSGAYLLDTNLRHVDDLPISKEEAKEKGAIIDPV